MSIYRLVKSFGEWAWIPSDSSPCICTSAIAGISDGPNVDCPIHGDGFNDD